MSSKHSQECIVLLMPGPHNIQSERRRGKKRAQTIAPFEELEGGNGVSSVKERCARETHVGGIPKF